jgi:hypothetical protein
MPGPLRSPACRPFGDDELSDQRDFIDRGCGLARDALASRVRYEVEEEFRERLAEASWIGWLRLRWTIRREIDARLERLAPRKAHYWTQW